MIVVAALLAGVLSVQEEPRPDFVGLVPIALELAERKLHAPPEVDAPDRVILDTIRLQDALEPHLGYRPTNEQLKASTDIAYEVMPKPLICREVGGVQSCYVEGDGILVTIPSVEKEDDAWLVKVTEVTTTPKMFGEPGTAIGQMVTTYRLYWLGERWSDPEPISVLHAP